MNMQLEQVSRVTTECMSFLWKIENFPSLRVKTGEFVRSSVVQCSDSHWCLKLFPNGKFISNQVEICFEYAKLASSPTLPSGVGYKIGLRNRSGKNCFDLFRVADPPSSSNEKKFQSSASISLESVDTTVTTHASSTIGASYASLTNALRLNNQETFGFSAIDKASVTEPVVFGATTIQSLQSLKNNCTSATTATTFASNVCTTASASTGMSSFKTTTGGFPFSSDAKSSSFVSNFPCPAGLRAKDSLPLSTSSSDRLASSIQPQYLIHSNISTKAPHFRFLNEKEETHDLSSVSKKECFLDGTEGMVVSRELLFKMAEDLLPNDVLTVVCEMEINIVVKVSESTRNKKISANKGHAALAENIGSIPESSRFSDVVVRVGEETFQAHKAILASRSRVFDGMFQSGMKENQESVVDIAEMKPTIVKEMLQYIYAGTIGELTMDAAIDLYVGSDRYDLQELKGWCKEFILEHISAYDVCRVAVTAHLHSDEELAMAAKRTFKENSKTVLLSEMWRDFGKKNPTLQTELLESVLLSEN